MLPEALFLQDSDISSQTKPRNEGAVNPSFASKQDLQAESEIVDPEFKSPINEMQNTPIGLSEDLCCSENPASPTIIKLECDESYDQGL